MLRLLKRTPPYSIDDISIYVADLVELTKLRNQAEQNSRLLAPDKGGREALEQWKRYNNEIDCAQRAHLHMLEENEHWIAKRKRSTIQA